MPKAREKNDGSPAFSVESLQAFIKWLHESRETIRSQKIASFLAVALEGKLQAGGIAPSTNSENIRDLGRILQTTLAVPVPEGMKLTEDGQMLANLFRQFADFVAACHGKPYQWRIGGADTAIQWLVSPSIPKICDAIVSRAENAPQTKIQRLKPVTFVFRTGRTETLKHDLLNSRIHFCVLRRGMISESLLRFDEAKAPQQQPPTENAKKRKGRLKAVVLGEFEYRVYLKRAVLKKAEAKVGKTSLRLWDALPFTMVGHHRVHLGNGKETELEGVFEDAALNIQLRCETAIQVVNMMKFGYAAVLASYFPKEEYDDIVEYSLKEFQIEVPKQALILVSPASLLDYNPTARATFDLLKADLQARLKT